MKEIRKYQSFIEKNCIRENQPIYTQALYKKIKKAEAEVDKIN